MELQLKYQLAGAELRRLARVPIALEIQIPTALAMIELIDVYLENVKTIPTLNAKSKTRELVVAFRKTVVDTLAGLDLENVLRRGQTLSTGLIFPKATGAAIFLVYNACLGGAHGAGKLSAGAWAVRVEVNRFASLIEGDFPTVAELLLLAQNGDARVDLPDPAGFAN